MINNPPPPQVGRAANLTPADHNIAMLQVAALGAAAAALHGEHDQTDKYLTLVMRNFAWYLEQRRTTGDQEGFLYTSFSMDNILVAADQIARVTGVEGLLADPYVSEANADGGPNLVHWMLAGLVPGGSALAPISDSAATRYFPVTSEVLAGRDGGEHAAWYLKQGSSTASVTNRFLYGSPDAEVEAPDLPLQGVDAASGWAHARSGWTAQDTLMIMVGNDSQVGHNHYDQNTILLGTNNQWIMSDPGTRDYIAGPGNVFTVSDGHTGISVDGQSQDRLGGSVMTAGVQSDGASYFTSDATAAYAGLGMSKVVRRVVALPDQYFYVVDELEAPEAHTYGWRMYNGNGASYAVDGRALAIGGSDTGSALALRTAQAQLVASFAGDEHTFSLATYDGAATYGPLTTVTNGPAATTGSFAVVLQAAPYDLPGITQAEGRFDESTRSEGVDARVLGIGGASLVFLRSVEAGHFVSFPFTVDTAGNHDIRVWLGMSPAYGMVQVSVDGTDVGEPYDCWTTASSGLTEAIDLGSVDLSSGEHTITFTAVAKNPSSSGWFLSVDAWQVTPTGEPVEAPLIEPVGLTDLVAANGRGARITRGDVTDVIGIRLAGTAALDLGGVRTDGDQFLVSTGDDGSIERIALSTGTSLTVGGRVLVAAGDVIDLGVRYAEDGAATVQLRATAATTVRVHQARPASVELNGERVRGRVDGRGRTVEVAIPAGESRLSWG
ncbi:heparinase II/III domain-containing protein [Microlunatus sp. Y2014]|uniref:heparinase II/III domain-containing protein n=1 Tax=Microlunatus sp. Y2014 TaxID=3418488 RepID=UPI003DA79766